MKFKFKITSNNKLFINNLFNKEMIQLLAKKAHRLPTNSNLIYKVFFWYLEKIENQKKEEMENMTPEERE
jgi:hypothetical protein